MTDVDVLQFEPDSELTFDKSILNCNVQLKLISRSKSQDVLFRVQTTSPATYRVRPSNGRIPAGSSIEVQVVMVTEPIKADKFLVKYAAIAQDTPAGEFLTLFKEYESSAQERRLRVAFTSPTAIPADSESINIPLEKAPSVLESPLPISTDAVAADLKEARAKIQTLVTKNQELTKALDEAKLMRRRNITDEADEHPATKLPQGISEAELNTLIDAQGGFPPVLVILIALFAFLLGLFF